METAVRSAPPLRWPGPRIANLRARLGVTQSVMADWLGYSVYRTVSDLETGQKRPSRSVMVLLDLIDEHDGLPSRETA